MTTKHNKLVRDKIPEIIMGRGQAPLIETLEEKDYREALGQKLLEEVNEYLESGALEELADIGEVMRVLLALERVPEEELRRVMDQKREERGGFEKRLFLVEVKG